jgi:Protein of unknown function (DUF3800)
MPSKYIVYVDESGDSSPTGVDPRYPVFVLAMCIFEIDIYVGQIVPSIQRVKFDFFDHDLAILHESEIRKKVGHFRLLNDRLLNDEFQSRLSSAIEKANFKVAAWSIDKNSQCGIADLYFEAAVNCLDSVANYMRLDSTTTGATVVFESRGRALDRSLLTKLGQVFDSTTSPRFDFRFVPKVFSSTGLQIADLVARPIGLHFIRPEQPNRSFEIIKDKLLG